MNAGTFVKGEKRPKQGQRGPNKVNKELKDMILTALDKAGGVDYLLECATEEKTKGAFLALIGKVLPMTIAGPGADGAHVFTVIERRIVKAGS
jgi:hypothetical protein